MEYSDMIAGIRAHSGDGADICKNSLGVRADQIRKNVVISPGWPPHKMRELGEAEPLCSCAPLYGFQVWDILSSGPPITYIKTGCGSPALLDAMIPLGVTSCKRILFLSSIGALDPAMHVGDLVLPECGVCGDGASRYIASGDLSKDVFGEAVCPDPALYQILTRETESVCRETGVRWHKGKAFCTDTMLGQYPYFHDILARGCNTLDMESAAAFRMGKFMGVPMAALSCVSDNSAACKSLVGGRTREEMEYREFVRSRVIPKIIRNFFQQQERT